MKSIPYGKQSISRSDIDALIEVLESDFLTQGPKVSEFETMFSKYVGAKFSFATSNGTTALHLAALALGVRPEQKVLCTSNTFVASSNCILYCGANVEFVDINKDDYCIDLELIEKKIISNPPGTFAGIVAVDFAGHSINAEKLRKVADKYSLWIIEDACHALGGEFTDSNGKVHKCGSSYFADASVFSFHPVKHITTGEGGIVTTRHEHVAKAIGKFRTHGITKNPEAFQKKNQPSWYYEMQDLGFNYRIPDILCALGISQLMRIDENIKARQKIAAYYKEQLKELPLLLPKIKENVLHAFHLFVIQTDRRNELYDYLKSKNIFTQVHYIPVHTQPFYEKKYGHQSLPVTEKYFSQTLSLPMYHGLQKEDQDRVIREIHEFFR